VLHLASRTDPGWGDWACAHVDAILADHAHCEKKAASTAINLIFRYGGEVPGIAAPLSALAREELEHFELVIAQLHRRGLELGRHLPSPYAAELMAVCRKGEPARLLDTLLCCAMIEARSCERMQLLHAALERGAGPAGEDRALVDLYASLLACEARHHASYVDLAREATGVAEPVLRGRLAEIAAHEAAVIARLPSAPRLHDNAAR
jgi:tRNA 2-(methylsulfanyl)-N6-isopentenyladenosine37 hydroxylase